MLNHQTKKLTLIFISYAFLFLYILALIGGAIRESLDNATLVNTIDNLLALARNFYTLIISIGTGVLYLIYIKKKVWIGIFIVALPSMLLLGGLFFLLVISLFTGKQVDLSEVLHW